jgi:phosphinothricin acetyltransferase
MSKIRIREASRADLSAITEIYNYYVIHTPITFDTTPFTPEQRATWFDDHCDGRRYRLLAAEENGKIVGYAGTGRFRAKPAYDTSVEATIYCASGSTRRGIGTLLYDALFEAIAHEDINRILGGTTLPKDASLHFIAASVSNKPGFSAKTAVSLDNIGTSHGSSAPYAFN